MNAIHIISTAPFFAKKGGAFSVEDFDLWCTVLSALNWRKHNGDISLCTDTAGAEYYRKIGLDKLWNDIRVCIPDDLEGVDPLMFWAGGKLFALRECNAPCVMIDTDFIVWDKLSFGKEIIAAHREDIYPDIYPPLQYFRLNQHILPPFDENVLPLNTAFLYLPDNDIKEFYVSQAIAFMKSAVPCDDRLCYMVMAEQRMLAMCAEYTGTAVKTLLDKDHLFFPQDSFTHLWGAKQAMRDDPKEREKFCRRCAERIRSDFPEYAYTVDIIEALNA